MVYIFGFPLDIGFTLAEPRPMARLGVVSLTADEAFLKDNTGRFFPKGVYVVDARMLSGNSGGPVFGPAPLTSAIKLRGLVTATNRVADFGVITPVSRIKEALDSAKEQSIEDFHPWKIKIAR